LLGKIQQERKVIDILQRRTFLFSLAEVLVIRQIGVIGDTSICAVYDFWIVFVEEKRVEVSKGVSYILLVDLGQELVIAEKRILILTNLDGRTTKLRNQNLVTGLNGRSDALAITVKSTGANSEDLCFVELLDGGLGEEDATGSLGLGLDALDEDAVEEGSEGLDGLGGDGGHFDGGRCGESRLDEEEMSLLDVGGK